MFRRLAAAAAILLLLLFSPLPPSIAAPIQSPDLRLCKKAVAASPANSTVLETQDCCLPWQNRPTVDFSWDRYPPPPSPRVRRAAHKVDADYIQKINRAYELMKALPDDDPRSFEVQAKIHCAFCNGAYKQRDTNITLQVHFSWFFLPWHRLYLYFHERILASLLGDPSFALVYWNWDNQLAPPNNDSNLLPNNMPRFFTVKDTPVYDARRNSDNDGPDQLVRLSVGSDSNFTDTHDEIRQENLNILYQAMVTADNADMFMGGPYRQGTDLSKSNVANAPLAGSLEQGIHSGVHFWTGDPDRKLRGDMGVFTTASRDPIFYAHHSDVDRLWQVWQTLDGGCRKPPSDPDFLDAEFLFYDENAYLVKVKVREALRMDMMGIVYEPADEGDRLWMNFEPKPAADNEGSHVEKAKSMGAGYISAADPGSVAGGGILVNGSLTVLVAVPGNGSGGDMTLVIQGLNMSRADYVHLKFFVNMPTAKSNTSLNTAEYVGAANILPSPDLGKRLFTNVVLEIGDNVKRLGLQNETTLVVTVVADSPAAAVTLLGMKITYRSFSCST